MLRAASKLLLRAQHTTATRYASIPWYRSTIRPCSSSPPFPVNEIGTSPQEEVRLIEHDRRSRADGAFHQTAAAPVSEQNDGFSGHAARNVASVEGCTVATEDGAQVAVAEVEVGALAESTEAGVTEEVAQEVAEVANVQAVAAAEGAECIAKIEAETPVTRGASKIVVDDCDGIVECVQPAEGLELGSVNGICVQLVENAVEAAEGDAKLEAGTKNPQEGMILPVKLNVGDKEFDDAVEAKDVEIVEKNKEEFRPRLPAARAPGSPLVVAMNPILMRPKAIEMLKKLGLYKFVRTTPPKVNKQLCNEFFASYIHGFHNGCAMVRGKMVTITPEAVHRVTGLPLGVEPMQGQKTQGKRVSSLGARFHRNVYDLKTVKLSENEEENEMLVAVAELLTKKMGVFPLGDGRVASRVLWGVHESWHGKTEVQWAGYMAELVRKKAEVSTTAFKSSKYGSWLTGLIRYSLRETNSGGGGDDNSRKIKLQQMEERERLLYAKEKEVRKREHNVRVLEAKEKDIEELKEKVRKHIAHCNRFAESVMNRLQ